MDNQDDIMAVWAFFRDWSKRMKREGYHDPKKCIVRKAHPRKKPDVGGRYCKKCEPLLSTTLKDIKKGKFERLEDLYSEFVFNDMHVEKECLDEDISIYNDLMEG